MGQHDHNPSDLEKAIKWLSHGSHIHICIHDISGVLQDFPALNIHAKNGIHSCYFCSAAKTTTTGLKFCLKCKSYSIKKALQQKKMFTGICYLGISEIIEPVFWNDKLICIIYLGNLLLEENKHNTKAKIDKACSRTGVKEDLLLDSLKTTQCITTNLMEEYKEIVEILRNIILNHLELGLRSPSKNPGLANKRNWIVESVKNHIFLYYNRDIHLSHLAKLYFIHPHYLCRLFKKETGMNFSDYINDTRIAHAKRLLSLTNDSIVEISAKIGFNNVTYFNRLFKKYTGQTPKHFRSVSKNEHPEAIK